MSTPQLAVEPIEKETEVVTKKAITNHSVLNEAFDYAKPSSFSRGLRLDIKGVTILLISGTASIDENGKTVHEGDFRAQTIRTYQNITGLLAAEGATWKDVVRTTCYLRDIERDYAAFNETRTQFFQEQGFGSLAGFHRHSGHSLPAGFARRDGSDGHLRRQQAVTPARWIQDCPWQPRATGRTGEPNPQAHLFRENEKSRKR